MPPAFTYNPAMQMRSVRIIVVISLALCAAISAASGQKREATVPGLPGPFAWQNTPLRWESLASTAGQSAESPGTSLIITAGKNTDWFVSPFGDGKTDASPRLLFTPAQDFVLSAKVRVDFRSTWDAGVLVVYAGERLWAKLCLEKTAEGHASIVSVVTHDLSDDSTHFPVASGAVYLQVAKAGQAIFFYASEDGEKWTVVRAFTLGSVDGVRAGFSAQSPNGEQCTATFTQIRYAAQKINLFAGK